MMLEIYGRRDGLCKGKGGSMHIADIDKGMLGANAIVGGGPPIAVGAAIACKLRGKGHVARRIRRRRQLQPGHGVRGDEPRGGARRSPAIFVFEDNGYGEHTGASYAVGSKDIAGRARGFGMAGRVCRRRGLLRGVRGDGARGRAREARRGPVGDRGHHHAFLRPFRRRSAELYRAKDEVARYRESMDCLKRLRANPREFEDVSAAADLDAIDAEVMELIERAVARSQGERALPPESDVATDVYIVLKAGSTMPQFRCAMRSTRRCTSRWRAMRASSCSARMSPAAPAAHPGERDAAGGIFGVTKGLLPKFGERRVIDTPISESAIVGAAAARRSPGCGRSPS